MARWPLKFSLQAPKPTQNGQQLLQAIGVSSNRPLPQSWWSHKLYRGPNNRKVQVIYSKTKDRSEAIAKQFLNEKVIGFDMEWPWNYWAKTGLQNQIGLIQIAAEDKIALFHIGLHPGETVDDIIAPSLKNLIENPRIGKLGVGVFSSDFPRLSRFFGLQPKGAVELSHLYQLIKYGAHKPELVSTKMVSLANQVQDQLGYPLYKGDVRKSDWSKPLSQDQMDYAAGDAYAGFMLYHCMNFKRLKMTPVPPMPIHADTYQLLNPFKIGHLQLQASKPGASSISSDAFFRVSAKKEDMARLNGEEKKSTTSQTLADDTVVVKKMETFKPKIPAGLVDPIARELYKELAIRRSQLATTAKVHNFQIAANAVLEALASKRPHDNKTLMNIKGIGTIDQRKYGHIWLETISRFFSTNGLSHSPTTPSNTAPTTRSSTAEHIATTEHTATATVTKKSIHLPSSPSMQKQPTDHDNPPTVHKDLTFSLHSIALGSKRPLPDYDDDDNNSSLPLLKSTTSPSHQTSKSSKHKRTKHP